MVTSGGSGDYVEGERVFAPPQGSFDPDWVAGMVLDRVGARAVSRQVLAVAALDDWNRRGRGVDRGARVAASSDGGLGPDVGAAVVSAVEDFVAAYAVD